MNCADLAATLRDLMEAAKHVHLIRLRGPWKFHDGTSEGDIRLPCDWSRLARHAQQTVRLCRSFHRPTGIGAGQRVFLRLTEMGACLSAVTFNDQPLPLAFAANDEVRLDVTSRLAARNRLELVVRLSPGSPCRPEIALAIEAEPAP